jgi:hypothetical protein
VSALEWRDRAYEETLESVLNGLETRRMRDPSFSMEDAEGALKSLYVQEGNDWCSRGMLQDAILAATIAAHEQFIASWEAESAPSDRSSHERGDPARREQEGA